MAPSREYPYPDGDITVLGPEIFASSDEQVICWKGVNYRLQPDPAEQDVETAATDVVSFDVTGPALFYVSTAQSGGTQSVQRIDYDVPADSRERAVLRALLSHVTDLLNASEPTRRTAGVAVDRRT